TLIPAATVATLENLQVVWTALAVIVLLQDRLPWSWVAGGGAAVAGAALISGGNVEGSTGSNALGIALGLASGVAFSVFVITWNGMGLSRRPLAERTAAMGVLLFVSGVVVYPVHLAVSGVLSDGARWPLTEIGFVDSLVQCVNGLVGIGVTYFLFNEASARLEGAGSLSAVLLALGLSFAVPVTLLTEWVVLG